MTSILVKALEDLLEVKNHKDIAGKDAWYNSNQPKAWQQAREALSLYSQSMNTEDHARDYYMNDDSQSKEGEKGKFKKMFSESKLFKSKENEGKRAVWIMEALNKKIEYLDKEIKEFEDGKPVVMIGGEKHLNFVRKNAMLSGLLIAKELLEKSVTIQSGERGEVEYWKARCESAENIIGISGIVDCEGYKQWQTLVNK